MKQNTHKLLLPALLLLAGVATAVTSRADEVHRDANGRIVATVTKTPGGFETVRDRNGKILEQKSTSTTGTTTVRDAHGKIIRTETKR